MSPGVPPRSTPRTGAAPSTVRVRPPSAPPATMTSGIGSVTGTGSATAVGTGTATTTSTRNAPAGGVRATIIATTTIATTTTATTTTATTRAAPATRTRTG